MAGKGGRRRRLSVNKDWAGLLLFGLMLLLMSAQVDGTVSVRLGIHHALANLIPINNKTLLDVGALSDRVPISTAQAFTICQYKMEEINGDQKALCSYIYCVWL